MSELCENMCLDTGTANTEALKNTTDSSKVIGYRRKNGKVGLRNHVVCLATVVCANAVVEGICREVPEVIPITHTDGCETKRVRTLYFTKTLENICNHPNNYAVLLVGLGCERDNACEIAKRLEENGVNVWARIIQEGGGCHPLIQEGAEQARKYLEQAKQEQPQECDLSEITVGIETSQHIFNESGKTSCAGSTADNAQAMSCAEDMAKRLEQKGASVILPSCMVGCGSFDGKAVKTIRYADSVQPGSGYYVIDQDHERWHGKKDGVFNMEPSESLLSMYASGAQVLLFASGRQSYLGFPGAPLIKYTPEEETEANAVEADVKGHYNEEKLAELERVFADVARGGSTYEERNNGCGDTVCTYRRTNIY